MRPAIFILLLLVLSTPTLANILNGSDSALNAGVHLGAATLVAWFAVGLVAHLVDNYRAATLRERLAGQAGSQPISRPARAPQRPGAHRGGRHRGGQQTGQQPGAEPALQQQQYQQR